MKDYGHKQNPLALHQNIGGNMNDIRIQKVLSENGIVSRRKAEELIEKGKIHVNGHPAVLGQKINPYRDVVTVNNERIYLNNKTQKVYIMLNKPRGYVTTMSDELGRRCVKELVEDAPERVYPIGRLDKDSEGLLLMTNDGDFANLIMHPSHHISKTYRVTVRPSVSEEQLTQLASGVEIDGRMTAPAVIHVLEKEVGRVVLQITIYEGRNRQIRKMCEAVGLEVARLKRTTVGPLKLGMLQPGEWRELKPTEVGMLRNAVKTAEESKPQKAAKEQSMKGRSSQKENEQRTSSNGKSFGRKESFANSKGNFASKGGKKEAFGAKKSGFGGKSFRTPSKGRDGGFHK